ncbi:hypothetical protein OPT61_g9829 [Boeremia exigua]|uniref:Uncharacterized protein n=1 Tax=Boeremia exigua TaxID=749465 RepID=A0ACC2HTA2_9PLEO|nr:hypothetical protein OPT61_g9829 [Boeremia exigua]
MPSGMARHRDEAGTRYQYADEHPRDDRESRHHRRHRSRDHDDYEYAAKRERRERRRAEDVRQEAAVDIDDLRTRRASYYSRPESDRYRDQDRMAHEARVESEKTPRSSHRELRRDGTRKTKKRDVIDVDRDEDYIYGQPKSSEIRRSSGRKKSEEGGSSSRTAYTPRSGSGSSRRVEEPKLSRSISTRETSSRYLPTRPTRRPSVVKLSSVPATTPIARSYSVREQPTRRNSGGIFATIFRQTPRSPSIKDVQRVDCLICMNDDIPINKTAKLACGHRMCHPCLKRQFTLSVKDPQHMPPRCCTKEHIPLKHVDRLFDDKFKRLWNQKFEEYTATKNLYCPAKGCGEWIKPNKVRVDLTTGRKYARCGRCGTKMAKEKGWQRCYNCKAVVELKEGCNHMTCRCNAQFCMVCALPWKTCNCPWFDYSHIPDEERPGEVRVPYNRLDNGVEVIEISEEPSPARRPSTRTNRTRHRSERDAHRDRADGALAAHLQSQRHLYPPNIAASSLNRGDTAHVEVYGLGNSGGHHMNDSYQVRPVNTSAAHRPLQVPAPRPSYVTSRRVVREVAAPAPIARHVPAEAPSSAMAGLSLDGTKRGANRVGTWLSHVKIDPEATNTQAEGVEVDDWRCDGTMIGID